MPYLNSNAVSIISKCSRCGSTSLENAVNRFGITERFRIINVKDAAKYSGWMNLKAGLPVRQRHHLKMFANSLVKCGVRGSVPRSHKMPGYQGQFALLLNFPQ